MGIEENIIPGKILYLNVCFPHEAESHNKFLVVVGDGVRPLFLKLNTEAQQSDTAKKFQERQFRAKKSVYPFLDHDRYFDCGTVWSNLISLEDIIKQITKEPNRIKGNIFEDHRNEIIRLTALSKSIEPKYKRIIAEALKRRT